MTIKNTLITTSNTTIFTSSGANAITTVIFCNTVVFDPNSPTTGQSWVTVYVVPSPDTLATKHMIVNRLPIPAGETVSLDQEKLVLSDGDIVVAISDTSNITSTVSSLAI